MEPQDATCYSSCCPSQKTYYDFDRMRCEGGGVCTTSNGEACPVGWRGNYTAAGACHDCFATALPGNLDSQIQCTCGSGPGQASSCVSSCCPSRNVYYVDGGAITCALGSCRGLAGGGCTPTISPTRSPTAPTTAPSARPSITPTLSPSARPTARPSVAPTPAPTSFPWTLEADVYHDPAVECRDCRRSIDPRTGVSRLSCTCNGFSASCFSSCCPSGKVRLGGTSFFCDAPSSTCAIRIFATVNATVYMDNACPTAEWSLPPFGLNPTGCSNCYETVDKGVSRVTCACDDTGDSFTSCFATCCPSRRLNSTNGVLTCSDGEICAPADGFPC